MKILSIETGTRCNNACLFCYQRDYRVSGVAPPEPTTRELLDKLALGRREGYDGVGFSGGEPTIRRDLPRLITEARTLGYQRISLTTNGRRLADPAYRATLLHAGLDAVGWSVHGARPETHDRLTGVPGSFAAVERGIIGTMRDSRVAGKHLDTNIFTVVTRENIDELPAICQRFRDLGVRLFIFQPPIFSRGTLADVGALALPLEVMLAGIRRATTLAAHDDYRVKLFNVPACLTPEEGTERERHRVRVFRGHERHHPGESRPTTPTGFVRLDACEGCAIADHCPGLHASLTPQAAVAAELSRAVDLRVRPGEETWLGGLELASADTVRATIRRTREAGASRIVLCTGASSVLGDELLPVAAAAGLDAVRFVIHRREPRSGDLRRATRGNLADVQRALRLMAEAGWARGVRREVGMLLERSERDAQAEELAALVDAGAQRLHLEVSPGDPELSERLVDAMRLVMLTGRLRPAPWAQRADVWLDVPAPVNALPAWQRWAARAVCRVADVRARFVHSALTGPGFGWVTDSVPAVALPGEVHEPERWPRDTLGPLVVDLDGHSPPWYSAHRRRDVREP